MLTAEQQVRFGAAWRRCLAELDVAGVMRLAEEFMPAEQRPSSRDDALRTLHMARTASQAMTMKARAYSHAWLLERGLPSMLPDKLRPRAQRMYPVIAGAVGISVNFGSKELKPAARIIQGAMQEAVENAYAEGRTEPQFIKDRMEEARKREFEKLFGRWGSPADTKEKDHG